MDNYTKLFDSLEDYNNSKYNKTFFPSVCKVKNNDGFIPKYNSAEKIIKKVKNNINPDILANEHLMLCLDAILNYKDGSGNLSHSSTTTTWYNLSPYNNVNASSAAVSWHDSCAWIGYGTATKPYNCGYRAYTNYTLEIVFTPFYNNKTGWMDILCCWENGGFGFCYNVIDSTKAQILNQQWNGGNYQTKTCSEYILLGTRYHIVYTYNNSSKTCKFYINGRYINSGTFSGNLTYHGTTVISLGSNPSGTNVTSSSVINANIYSVKIYNSVLTDEQIRNNFEYEKIRYDIPV